VVELARGILEDPKVKDLVGQVAGVVGTVAFATPTRVTRPRSIVPII
jgi:hypothetical protein